MGLPHAALLRNLANNALRRAAEAGNPRALMPSEPYASPQDAVEAAAEAAEQLAAEAAAEGARKELAAAAVEAAANAAALAEIVEVGAEPLQLPMPPQLPLYHSAVLQHLRVCRGHVSGRGIGFNSGAQTKLDIRSCILVTKWKWGNGEGLGLHFFQVPIVTSWSSTRESAVDRASRPSVR